MARRIGGGPGAVDKAKDFKGTLKKFLKIVDISLDSVIIYRCQGGPDTKYIIIH